MKTDNNINDMKREYSTPIIKVRSYAVEAGFAVTLALERDSRLEWAGDDETMRSHEELTELTDNSGEYTAGYWE